MIHYEKINFLNDFKERDGENKLGYILKIAYIMKYKGDYSFYDGWKFYNKRDRTSVDCIDGEIIISSKYDLKNKNSEKQRHYMLIQIDFSTDKKYKILKESNKTKKPLIDYIIENNLVEIKEVSNIPIWFQFEDNYFIDVIEEIYEKIDKNIKEYNIEELKNILIENLIISEKYPKLLKERAKYNYIHDTLNEMKYKLLSMTEGYIYSIFKYVNVEKMTIDDVLKYIKMGKENYYYDIRG